MEKKFYLKPDTEVLDVLFENELLAGTVTYDGTEDEIIIPEPSNPGGKPIHF